MPLDRLQAILLHIFNIYVYLVGNSAAQLQVTFKALLVLFSLPRFFLLLLLLLLGIAWRVAIWHHPRTCGPGSIDGRDRQLLLGGIVACSWPAAVIALQPS